MIESLKLALSFFPPFFIALVLGIIALFVIVIVFKIVRLVLDAIPFL